MQYANQVRTNIAMFGALARHRILVSSQIDESADRTDSLAGDYGRRHLCTRVIWCYRDDAISRELYRSVVANLHLFRLWLGFDRGPPYHYHVFVHVALGLG